MPPLPPGDALVVIVKPVVALFVTRTAPFHDTSVRPTEAGSHGLTGEVNVSPNSRRPGRLQISAVRPSRTSKLDGQRAQVHGPAA